MQCKTGAVHIVVKMVSATVVRSSTCFGQTVRSFGDPQKTPYTPDTHPHPHPHTATRRRAGQVEGTMAHTHTHSYMPAKTVGHY